MKVGAPRGVMAIWRAEGTKALRRPEARPALPLWASPHKPHPEDLKEPHREGSLLLVAEGKP